MTAELPEGMRPFDPSSIENPTALFPNSTKTALKVYEDVYRLKLAAALKREKEAMLAVEQAKEQNGEQSEELNEEQVPPENSTKLIPHFHMKIA